MSEAQAGQATRSKQGEDVPDYQQLVNFLAQQKQHLGSESTEIKMGRSLKNVTA